MVKFRKKEKYKRPSNQNPVITAASPLTKSVEDLQK